MSRFPVARMIGLVRRLDGYYEPSSANSWVRLKQVSATAGIPLPTTLSISKENLPEWRRAAAQCGFKIVISIKSIAWVRP